MDQYYDLIQWQSYLEQEVQSEYKLNDPVYRSITKKQFISRSKGRNRTRKHPKEITLLRYHEGLFFSYHRFPFDIYATEIIGQTTEAETILRNRIDSM